jgi:DNA repair protein RecO (recombination protein O)
MAAVTTDALVLHAFDYLETSRILRLATRECGLVSVIARGARRSVKRFGAALDLFASGVAELRLREGRDLQELVAFDVRQARPALALDLDRFASASMLVELALRCSAGDDHGLYDAVTASLDAIEGQRGEGARTEGVRWGWRLAAALGFGPSLDQCAQCHAPIPVNVDAHFSTRAGGALCTRCARNTERCRVLPAAARDQLRRWLEGGSPLVPDARSQRAHARLLNEFLLLHATEGAALRAFDAWRLRFGGARG